MIFALSVNKNQRSSIIYFFQFGIINWADNVNWPFRALALRHLLRRRANARNVSFETLNGGQFTLSTQLIIPNYVATVSYWRSTKLSLLPSFKYLSGDPSPFHQGNLNSGLPYSMNCTSSFKFDWLSETFKSRHRHNHPISSIEIVEKKSWQPVMTMMIHLCVVNGREYGCVCCGKGCDQPPCLSLC